MNEMMKDLETFLLREVAADIGRRSLMPGEDLLGQRIIDSLGILRLVTFLEERHGIRIADAEIVPENFQDLNSIARFVEGKMPAR